MCYCSNNTYDCNNQNISIAMANNLELQQEAELKLKAKAIVENYIKSYGENPEDYNEVFYNKKQSIGLNVVSYMEELAFDILNTQTKQ